MLWPIKHVFIASKSTSLTLWTTFILTEESKVRHCRGSLRMEASWALCFFHLPVSHLQSIIQATEEQLWNCSSPWHESRAGGDRGTHLLKQMPRKGISIKQIQAALRRQVAPAVHQNRFYMKSSGPYPQRHEPSSSLLKKKASIVCPALTWLCFRGVYWARWTWGLGTKEAQLENAYTQLKLALPSPSRYKNSHSQSCTQKT